MIEVLNIVKSYGENNPVLRDISLQISDGEFTVILGASGSGKSTFLNILSGLEHPDSGQVKYGDFCITDLSDNELTRFRKENVGFIFQQYYLLPNMTVEQNVKMGADLVGNQSFSQIIEAVGLADKVKKYPSELSGGEQQRVSIARAIVNGPPLLIADEPTGNLDPKNSMEIMQILEQINEKGITVIVSTHDRDIVDYFRKRVITMEQGQIIRDVQAGTYE